MKIGLINMYSTHNLGDAAIYAALDGMLQQHQLSALVAENQLEQIQGWVIERQDMPCDAYISVGGDIFNNSRPNLITRNFLSNLWQLFRQRRKTLLFGQSIPRSCQGLAFALLCDVLKTLPSVTVRDQESWGRLCDAGVNADLSYDLAFFHYPKPQAKALARDVLFQHQLTPSRTVLISLRHFDDLYKHDNQRFINNLVYLCQGLNTAGLQPALLLQSQAEGDDGFLAQAVRAQLPSLPVIDALRHPESLKSYEFLQGLLAVAGLTVGVRYHASVLALAAGRMPFNLHYSNKGQDLCDRLAVPGCNVADFDPQQGIEPLLACVGRSFNDGAIRQRLQSQLCAALETVPGQELCRVMP